MYEIPDTGPIKLLNLERWPVELGGVGKILRSTLI